MNSRDHEAPVSALELFCSLLWCQLQLVARASLEEQVKLLGTDYEALLVEVTLGSHVVRCAAASVAARGILVSLAGGFSHNPARAREALLADARASYDGDPHTRLREAANTYREQLAAAYARSIRGDQELVAGPGLGQAANDLAVAAARLVIGPPPASVWPNGQGLGAGTTSGEGECDAQA